MYKPHLNRGTAIYDSAFEISTSEAQTKMLQACSYIEHYPCTVSGCAGGNLTYTGSVKCYQEDFNTWWATKSGNAANPTGATFLTELIEFRSSFNSTKLGVPYDYSKSIGVVDGQVKYVAIEYTTTLLRMQPYGMTKAVYDLSEMMLSRISVSMPSGLKRILNVSGMGEYGRVWDYLTVQAALVKGLFNGFAICFPASFLVLLFATYNVLTAFYAIVTIAAIIASVLGFISAALGYALGIVETIAAVCVIGFSVDYTVHLAHMYHESDLDARMERACFAALHMGPTVFGGAVTTVGAALFLFGCILTFFTKMGTIMCVTIFTSYVYSMLFFIPCLVLFGPEGEFGSLNTCKNMMRGMFLTPSSDAGNGTSPHVHRFDDYIPDENASVSVPLDGSDVASKPPGEDDLK